MTYSHRKIIQLRRVLFLFGAGLGVVVVAATLLAGCGAGGGMPIERGDAPGLVGTWRTTQVWTASDGQPGHNEEWLTFTGDGRAVLAWSRYEDGTFDTTWSNESGWEATDNVVTRLWFADYTDDDVDNPVHGSTEREFNWANDNRSSVYIEPWLSRTSNSVFLLIERVPASDIPSVVGSWVYDDRGVRNRVFTLDVTPSTFRLTETPRAEDLVRVWEGVPVLDEVDYRITLTGLTYAEYNLAGMATRDPEPYNEGSGVVRYVPSDRGLVMSFWQEQDPDEHPYGDYWLDFERSER